MLDARGAVEVAGRYSLGASPVLSGPVARGEFGQVWRLETSLGAWAVKEALRPPETDDIEDVEYQEAARANGVPTPSIVRTTEGEVFADLGTARVRVYGWVDLLDRDPHVDPAAVGRLIASLHRVPFSGHRPVHYWYVEPVGARRWGELVAALTEAGAPFAGDLAGMRDELVALEGLLVPPIDLQTCHRDLWAENVRATANGDLCIIDWDDCGLADPSQELGMVLFEFGDDEPERARALYEAYVEGGGPGRIERPSDFSMLVAQLGHINENACESWLDASASSPERDRQAARFGEAVERQLTLASIDQLLDAVTS